MFESKPGKIMVHANTFDLTKQINSLDLYEKILNKHNKILPSTELVFSEIILRKDNPCLINIQKKTNERLKNVCQQNRVAFIVHYNLAKKQHLGIKSSI